MAHLTEIAPGIHQLALDPIQGVNCYLAGEVLIDAGGRLDRKRILGALTGRTLNAHALTHVHPDHQGSSDAVCTERGVPFWVPAAEREQAESGDCLAAMPDNRIARFSNRVFAGPGHSVDRELTEGDVVGGLTAVALPGHSPGQLGYWRESDRVLVCGDALRNMSYATGRPGLRLPPDFFSTDMDEVRRSAEKIAEMRPALLAFGHGRPIAGADTIARKLEALLG